MTGVDAGRWGDAERCYKAVVARQRRIERIRGKGVVEEIREACVGSLSDQR